MLYQGMARTAWTADPTPSTPASSLLILCWSNPTMSSLLPAKMWTMSASENHQPLLLIFFYNECFVFSVLFPKTWSEFVTCIKQYTNDCLTSDQVIMGDCLKHWMTSCFTFQRSDFNRAVGDSINSVHKMCTNEDYKQGRELQFIWCKDSY